MVSQIISAAIGFILGILAIILVQKLLARWRSNDPGRLKKLEHLHKLRAWVESYRALFDCIYPECPELILAHKMLSKKFPNYDKTSPIKLYEALKEYQDRQRRHEELGRQAEGSIQALSNKNLDRLYGLNKALTSFLVKVHLLKNGWLLPVSFSTDVNEHLKLVEEYREKVFEAFPKRFVQKIDWDKLDSVEPADLASLIHPRLKYYTGDEAASAHRQTESRRFDEMQNLDFYRVVAKKEIEAILEKIQRQEEKYACP
jgi:hypothetical protein